MMIWRTKTTRLRLLRLSASLVLASNINGYEARTERSKISLVQMVTQSNCHPIQDILKMDRKCPYSLYPGNYTAADLWLVQTPVCH